MESKIINQHEAIKLIEAGADISALKVVFNEEKIEALQAILLGKNKIEVPSELIYYDDDTIDFSVMRKLPMKILKLENLEF